MEEAIGAEALGRYRLALGSLQPSDRAAIIARVERGLEYAEVARALGKPSVAAAYVAVSRALARLAERMEALSTARVA
jgi:DNA-directed RNA polymerase specialized sigma24 family protein